jgi:hypothetical protein
MHLTSFKISDFRSYRTIQELRLGRHITILAGRNNVGKTALLRALRLPVDRQSGTGLGFRAEYMWELTHQELAAALPDLDSALIAVGISQPPMRHTLTVTLADLMGSGAGISFQGPTPWVGNAGMALVSSGIADTALRLQLSDIPSGQTGAGRSRHVQLWWDGLDAPQDEHWHRLAQSWVTFISDYVANSYYLMPRRIGAQTMPFVPTTKLEPDGSNLTSVVATLYTNHRRKVFEPIESFMRAAFPEISHIDVQMEGSPPAANIHVVYGQLRSELAVPLRDCGTGIEQMLMIAVALFTLDSPRLFLIDEPHAFLHPSAERHLLRLIQAHPEHQYLIATHSGVFLTSVPITQTRLITLDGSGSHINDVHDAADILTELGVTAADLWSADALFWIEGRSDVGAVEELIAHMPEVQDVTIRVLAMPDWIRSLSSSERRAESVVRFCEAVRAAITPFKVPSVFVFDTDEKTEAFKERIVAATGNRARFLPVRELENLLLVPAAINKVLGEVCLAVGMPTPTVNVVAHDIKQLLAQTDDRKLYKIDPGTPDPAKIVGSEVLGRLWWKWASTSYDKVEYGDKLVKAVDECEPDRLELLRELAESARTNHPTF